MVLDNAYQVIYLVLAAIALGGIIFDLLYIAGYKQRLVNLQSLNKDVRSGADELEIRIYKKNIRRGTFILYLAGIWLVLCIIGAIGHPRPIAKVLWFIADLLTE